MSDDAPSLDERTFEAAHRSTCELCGKPLLPGMPGARRLGSPGSGHLRCVRLEESGEEPSSEVVFIVAVRFRPGKPKSLEFFYDAPREAASALACEEHAAELTGDQVRLFDEPFAEIVERHPEWVTPGQVVAA